MTKQPYAKLTIPTDLTYLPLAQLCVKEVAGRIGFEGKALAEIDLAVEEAVSNVVEHAFAGDEQGAFDVICEGIPKGLRVILKEKGLPFDPGRIPTYAPEQAGAESVSGMGVFLMQKTMDEVSFHNLGSEGKETRLLKYLPGRNIWMLTPEGELAAPPRPQPAIITEKLDYDVRLLQPSEAIEVARCAYKSHGYTFFEDHIYYPEQIIAMNESGQMVSAVAVARDGRFMGHAALVYPELGARIAELTFVFVNVEYRGQGCMNRLCEFLFSEAPSKHELSGIYAYAVTNHPYTQKAMVKYGINDCGLLLATSPASWEFKGIAADASQRISVLLSFKYLEPAQQLTLYPPDRHREMIGRLYRNLGAAPLLETPSPEAGSFPSAPSVFSTTVYESEGCAEIYVSRFGADAVHEIRKALRALCLRQVAAVNLFLPLQEPATFCVTSELEQLGFFFAGVLPETPIGDALILQYLNNVPLDYGKIVLYTDMAKEIMAYSKACDPNASL